MSTKLVLEQLLGRHRLDRPDARPLWQYAVAADEIDTLLTLLAGQSPHGLSLADQGALALVASHVQCPDDVDTDWSWKLLRSVLPWAADPASLYRNLEPGFTLYWRRGIRRYGEREHRAFLGACFAEGGLPALWLGSSHNVGRYIRGLVRRSELYRAPATVLAQSRSESFAEGIQDDELYELFGQLAQELVALRGHVPPNSDSPTRYLDTVLPKWRDGLPVRIARARTLDAIIDSLLADSGGAEASTQIVEVITVLEGAHCVRRLRVASKVSPEQLASQAEVTDEEAGGLLYLLVQTSSGSRKQIARLERDRDEGGRLWRVFRDKTVLEFASQQELRIVVSVRGEQRGQFTPLGGEALDDDAPWIFSLRDEAAPTLEGVGSAQVTAARALVSIPASWAPPTCEDASSRLISSDRPHLPGRQLYELSGSATAVHADESFRIETNASTTSSALMLVGKRLGLAGPDGQPFVGPPQVFRTTAAGIPAPVREADLRWRRLDGGPWRTWVDQPLGAITLRTTNGGRARATIVSSNFRVQADNHGNIRVSARKLSSVVANDRALTATTDRAQGFCLAADDTYTGADVFLNICFANSTPFQLAVPVHSGRAGFVDEHGRWLPPNAHLSLDGIDNLRARGLGNLKTSLEVRARGMNWDWLTELPPSSEGVSELYLADLRDELTARLRASGELEDHLELRVATLGVQTMQSRCLQIGHYWLELVGDSKTAPMNLRPRVLGTQSFSGEPAAGLSAWRMDLANPAEDLFPLPLGADGNFSFSAEGLCPGPYLAILQRDERVVGRPRLVTVAADADPPRSSAYSCAATRKSEAERRVEWQHLCSAMENDWGHPDWLSFQHLIRHGRALPASTFEFMRASANAPGFLAAALMHGADRTTRLDIIRQLEEVGVFWPALPLTSWFAAVRSLKSWLDANAGLAAALGGRSSVCPLVYDDKEPELRFLAILRDLEGGADQRTAPSCLSLPQPMLDTFVHDAKQELLTKHTHETWPQQRVSSDLERLAGAVPYRDDPPFRRAVLQAPYIAAQLSVRGQVLERRDGWALRALRSFDVEWFDAAHTFHLASLVQKNRKALAGDLHA